MTKIEKHDDFLTLIAGMLQTVGRTGAVVCIRNREEGDVTMVHDVVGTLSPESSAECRKVSRLKITMLCEGPEGVETSYELRDPANGRWGGGFTIGGETDIAISGLPEKWDMACGLHAAEQLGMISREDMYRLAAKADGVTECLEILDRVRGIII